MRIVQLYSALAYGDGVTNCIISLKNVFDSIHIRNIIFAQSSDERCKIEDVSLFSDIQEIDFLSDDIIFYHFANGCELNNEIEHLKKKKILVYHNVTEPDFYRFVDKMAFISCLNGKFEATHTPGNYLKAITMSNFSKSELLKYGWKEKDVYVIPLVERVKNKTFQRAYWDRNYHFLYVGRIAPNKKIDDLIEIFDYYNKHYDDTCKLIMVGDSKHKVYQEYISQLLLELGNSNIVWKGHISDDERDEEYAKASIYLSMSEHEGFCMPLLEAMRYDLPVVAYSSTAVSDTLGEAGVLLKNKEPAYVCQIIYELLHNSNIRANVITKQRTRLQEFCIENYVNDIKKIIRDVNLIKVFRYECDHDKFYHLERKFREKAKNTISIDKLNKDQGIVVYGCGKYGKSLIKVLIEEEYRLLAVCDNHCHDKEVYGKKIYNVKDCIERYPNEIYIISSVKNVISMLEPLIKHGVDRSRIILLDGQNGKLL